MAKIVELPDLVGTPLWRSTLQGLRNICSTDAFPTSVNLVALKQYFEHLQVLKDECENIHTPAGVYVCTLLEQLVWFVNEQIQAPTRVIDTQMWLKILNALNAIEYVETEEELEFLISQADKGVDLRELAQALQTTKI